MQVGVGSQNPVKIAATEQAFESVAESTRVEAVDVEIGAGPRIRLPEGIGARIQAGEELGPIMDEVLGQSNVARNQGAAGALTGGIIDRESALRHAVAGALGPFVTPLYETGAP